MAVARLNTPELAATASRRHPERVVDPAVATRFDTLHVARERALAAERKWLAALRPNAAQRKLRDTVNRKLFGKNWDAASKAATTYAGYSSSDLAHMGIDIADASADPHFPWTFEPPPLDNTFWWAETVWNDSGRGINVEYPDDGIHFYGRVSYNGDDLIGFSASARSRFVLTPDRIPASPTGRYNSEPAVQLTRGIDGWTGFYDPIWAADDKWCKCNLVLRQTIIQTYFGQTAVRGDRTEVRSLINEENESRGVRANLPGFVEMPALQISPATNLPLYVELEVRFDMQLEGDSFIGFSPEQNSAGSVLLLMQQWPLKPA